MWVCLKMSCTPLYPMVLLIIIPFLNCYFIGNINPTFSDKPMLRDVERCWEMLRVSLCFAKIFAFYAPAEKCWSCSSDVQLIGTRPCPKPVFPGADAKHLYSEDGRSPARHQQRRAYPGRICIRKRWLTSMPKMARYGLICVRETV